MSNNFFVEQINDFEESLYSEFDLMVKNTRLIVDAMGISNKHLESMFDTNQSLIVGDGKNNQYLISVDKRKNLKMDHLKYVFVIEPFPRGCSILPEGWYNHGGIINPPSEVVSDIAQWCLDMNKHE